MRFVANDARIYYGDAVLPKGVTDISKAKKARVITGDIFGKHEVTSEALDIRFLLPPLAPEHTGTVRCLGLNYALHAKESGLPEPKFPVLFYKPATSLAGPADPIPVPPLAQEGVGLDYECELMIVIGKKAKQVSEEEALDYVLGYTVGNDVSHRDWQLKHGGGQWSLGKGFDGWAPYGPGIVTSNVIKDPQTLNIWTKVNGEKVQVRFLHMGSFKKRGLTENDVSQDGDTGDMIFNVKKTISFLSQTATLVPGDIIFTGTYVPLLLKAELYERTKL